MSQLRSNPPADPPADPAADPAATTAARRRFRRATVADIAELSAIRLSVGENALSDPARIPAAMYADYLTVRGRGWVCELDGQIVGFAIACAVDASIWALFVRQAHEGRGIGRHLLDLAVAWLEALGKTSVALGTAPGTRADRLYERAGWQRGAILAGEVRYVLPLPRTRGAGRLPPVL